MENQQSMLRRRRTIEAAGEDNTTEKENAGTGSGRFGFNKNQMPATDRYQEDVQDIHIHNNANGAFNDICDAHPGQQDQSS